MPKGETPHTAFKLKVKETEQAEERGGRGVCVMCVVCVARGCSVYDADILSLLSLFCLSLSLSHSLTLTLSHSLTHAHTSSSSLLKVVVQDQKFKPQNFLASGRLEINDGSSFIMMKKGCDEDGTFRVEVLYMS